ncbi:hypothetical protein EV2_006696 [Malus domestica]
MHRAKVRSESVVVRISPKELRKTTASRNQDENKRNVCVPGKCEESVSDLNSQVAGEFGRKFSVGILPESGRERKR